MTLLAGSSLVVATLVAAPAARASTAFTDLRADATMSELPISTTVELGSFAASADDPTDCGTLVSSAWTQVELSAPSTIDVGSAYGWSWDTVVAFYPVGSDTAAGCKAMNVGRDAPFEVAAGTYDVVVGTAGWWLDPVNVTVEALAPPTSDDWTAPQPLSLPASPRYDLRLATMQPDESTPPCAEQTATVSQWYSFTAPGFGWIHVSDNWTMTNTYALYTASTTGGPPLYAGQCVNTGGTLRATPGVEYLLQVAGYSRIAGSFSIQEESPLAVRIGYWPGDPSTYDAVDLSVYIDNGACESATLDFGDGTPVQSTTDCLMSAVFHHTYAKDGMYTLTASSLAKDGRAGTDTETVVVRTHDVALTALNAPKTAVVGKAKQVSLSVANLGKYAEKATVVLYASTGYGDWTPIGTTQVSLPVSKKSLALRFTWIPAAADIGRGVVLRAAVENLIDPSTEWTSVRDARPSNNELSSAPIKVSR